MSRRQELTSEEISLIWEIVARGINEETNRPEVVAEVIGLGFDRTTAIGLVTKFDREIRSHLVSEARGKRTLNMAAIGIGLGAGLIGLGNELTGTETIVIGAIVLAAGVLLAIRYLSWTVRSRRRVSVHIRPRRKGPGGLLIGAFDVDSGLLTQTVFPPSMLVWLCSRRLKLRRGVA